MLQKILVILVRLMQRNESRRPTPDPFFNRQIDIQLQFADQRRLRRIHHVIKLLGKGILHLEFFECIALASALSRRDLPRIRPGETVIRNKPDESLRPFALPAAQSLANAQNVLIAKSSRIRADLRQRRTDVIQIGQSLEIADHVNPIELHRHAFLSKTNPSRDTPFR